MWGITFWVTLVLLHVSFQTQVNQETEGQNIQ